MFLSVVRISALILAVVILLSFLAVPVCAAESGNTEIILREDGLLQSSLGSLAAGIGAAVCVALVFVIVWKQWEL